MAVIDVLPVTDVGKPYKLALRADAARRVAEQALDGVPGVGGVVAVVEDGSVVIAVSVTGRCDVTDVKTALDRYPLAWRLEEEQRERHHRRRHHRHWGGCVGRRFPGHRIRQNRRGPPPDERTCRPPGFGVSAYRRIGAVEVAGAIGLFVGFVFPVIGIAAALGFVLLLGGGAALTHVRAGDNTKELAPALAVGVIAVASLVLFVIEATS